MMIDHASLGFALFVEQERKAGRNTDHTGMYGRSDFVWNGQSALPPEADLVAMGKAHMQAANEARQFIEQFEGQSAALYTLAKALNGDAAAQAEVQAAVNAAQSGQP